MVLMLMMGTRRNGINLTKYLLQLFFNEPEAHNLFLVVAITRYLISMRFEIHYIPFAMEEA